MHDPDTVVVFSGGPRPARHVVGSIPVGAPIVAADRGADHALALGLRVEVAVGDFDSVGARSLQALERAGTRIERHPPAKDATDLELALGVAAALGPRRILVIGARGGRLDHLAGGLLLLAADAYAGVEVDALIGSARVHVIRGERTLPGRPRELISLLALHGPARGVSSDGLAYPLRDDLLAPGSSRGVSNIFVADRARIAVRWGVVVAICPGTRASPAVVRGVPGSGRGGNASS